MSRRGDMTTLPPTAPGPRRRLRPAPDGAGRGDQAGQAGPAGATRGSGRAAAAGTGKLAASAAPAAGNAAAGRQPGPPARRRAGPAQSAAAGPAQTAGGPARPGSRRPGSRRPGQPGSADGAQPRPRTRPLQAPARRLPGTGPGAAAPARRPVARPGSPQQESRTRFVFLVLGLLGGGLVSLLIINTILAAGSLRITQLQQANVKLARQSQELQAQIDAERNPESLYQRARKLGMTAPPLTHYLDLKKGRIISQPARIPGVFAHPPGYSP